MAGFAWSQLRFRTTRFVTLLLGLALATSAFTVLTAASKTAQLRTVGTVSSHFVPSYDILVRPRGARTALETRTDTVQPNFLSGIYGGITIAQYRAIAHIRGVEVAAPIAMVGYALLNSWVPFRVPSADYHRPGRQLYRVSTTWVSDGGTTRIHQPDAYLYVTPRPLSFVRLTAATDERLPHHRLVTACPFRRQLPHENPFGVAAQSGTSCWSKTNGLPPFQRHSSHATVYVPWVLPVLIAAIDPSAEAKLDGLNRAVATGSYLSEHARDGKALDNTATFPVLASSTIGMNEFARTRLQELPTPGRPPRMTARWIAGEVRTPGRTIDQNRSTAGQAYRRLVAAMRGKAGLPEGLLAYWSVGPVSYRTNSRGALVPWARANPLQVWRTPGFLGASMDNRDVQYRRIVVHSHASNKYSLDAGAMASPRLVGTFDPSRITSFDRLAQIPLGAYESTTASPGDAASTTALRGDDLLPNQNLGGYVSQPVNLVTSLSALPALQNPDHYAGNLHSTDPISVIRVRVAGVTGPDALSLDRVRSVAQQIEARTHLDVDIVDGASGAPTAIELPPGRFGRPALALTENWVKKGVALTILKAVDKDSVALYLLILVVCALFIANSAYAAVRTRRQELGVLACLGWTRSRLFVTVLGELLVLGLAAGALGCAVALVLAPVLGLHAPPGRALLAIPVAIGLALVSGLPPALSAGYADPAAAVRPAVAVPGRPWHPASVAGLAAVNVMRRPGRTLVAVLALAVGVVAMTVLAAITFAFHGVLLGTLIGDAVSVEVRGVDYVAAGATIALGVLAVVDMLLLSIRERAPELSAVRSFGWPERTLARLVVTEAAIVGAIGSVLGITVGLFVATRVAGQLPDRLYLLAAIEVVAGVLITSIAALLPAQALRRLPTAQLLVEE